jgi:hypothetical protein
MKNKQKRHEGGGRPVRKKSQEGWYAVRNLKPKTGSEKGMSPIMF